MTSRIPQSQAAYKAHSLFFGVDLGGSRHTAIVLDERSQQLARFTFSANREGFIQFDTRRQALIRKHGASDTLVGMEPSGAHWKLLAADLEQRNVPYVLVNAYTVHVYRQAINLDRSKDDFRDAYAIADLVRIGKFTRTRLQHGDYAELRELSHRDNQLQQQIACAKNELRSTLMRVFPELNHLLPDMDALIAQAVLHTCAVACVIRRMSEDEFTSRVRVAYKGKMFPAARVRRIYQTSLTSIGLKDATTSAQMMVNQFTQQIDLLAAQRKEVQQLLEVFFLRTPEAQPMLSMPELSPCTAAKILGEIGDPRHYDTGKQLVKLAGLQPTPNTSGNKIQSKTPISRQGRAGLRTALYYITLRLLRRDKVFRERYLYLQQRPVNPLTKMQAIVALMAKLLRVLWALMYNQSTYSPIGLPVPKLALAS
jgi:transposase